MKFKDCFATALRALLSNKLRSALTMLGILIGIAAVISVMSLGRAQEAETQKAFASLGSNLIYVVPGADVGQGGMSGSLGSSATLTMEVLMLSPKMLPPWGWWLQWCRLPVSSWRGGKTLRQ